MAGVVAERIGRYARSSALTTSEAVPHRPERHPTPRGPTEGAVAPRGSSPLPAEDPAARGGMAGPWLAPRRRGGSRMKKLSLVCLGALAVAGCAPNYVYAPAENATATVGG